MMKIERAKHHIDDLNRQAAKFFEQAPCSFVFVRDFKARQCATRFEQRKAIPEEFGLLIGDAVHNLRSALDLACWRLVSPRCTDPDRVQFPFCKTANGFESVIKSRQVNLAGPKVVDAIRDLKPYPGGNDDLYGLYRLDIEDKHKILIPTVSAATLDNLSVPNLDTSTPAFQMMKRAAFIGLEHKKEIVRFEREPPPRRHRHAFEKEQDIGGAFTIAFGKGLPFEMLPTIPALVAMTDAAVEAVEALDSLP
jgi:hypothetical protein